jgi:predicted NBD/HSP70 family sugar kinase
MPMPVRNLVRAMNRAKILDTIRNADLISRIDIARATGLSQASVTGLTSDLIKEGLISEKQTGEYEGGRRPMLLGLNPSGAYVVGVNLTLGEVNVVIANFKAEVIQSHSRPLLQATYSVEAVADRIGEAVQACIWEANFSKDQIAGVGLGIPGLVDSATGLIRFMPNYGWENVQLKDLVQNRLNHPCFIDNSSNTLAIAEQWFGEGKGLENFLVVTIENGIGLGAVINGRVYRGAEGIACEFGHITIDPQGPRCRCGKKGCVESYVGNIAILRDAGQSARRGEWQPDDPERISFEEVVAAARKGTPPLAQLFEHAGRMLGIGLVHINTLFNPQVIIITGKGVLAGDMMFDAMRDSFRAYLPARFGPSRTRLVIKQWTEQDWARGAGALVLQELYKSPVSQDHGGPSRGPQP